MMVENHETVFGHVKVIVTNSANVKISVTEVKWRFIWSTRFLHLLHSIQLLLVLLVYLFQEKKYERSMEVQNVPSPCYIN
jgi:hypothetical protein